MNLTRIRKRSLRRQGQSLEKINRGMILAPLVGIVLNLLDASVELEHGEHNNVADLFANMGCGSTIHSGFQYLLEYNWAGSLRVGDASLMRLKQLENFSNLLRSKTDSREVGKMRISGLEEDTQCCICYACDADGQFEPCSHRSCFGCITRHLLNCQRCFFCNTPVLDVIRVSKQAL